MLKKKSNILVTSLITCILLLTSSVSLIFAQETGTEFERLAGANRYETAIAVSQQGWSSSDYAVLARGESFADALCAGPLASQYGGPILLTEPNTLNSKTLKELQRLKVKHLFVIGGPNAISQDIDNVLRMNGITNIERIYGNDRYETSVKIAEKIGNKERVVLATGKDFPDALSISGIAAQLAMPILLTEKDELPGSVEDYLNNKTVTKTYIIGGINVISNEIYAKVANPVRLAGFNRYETNVEILKSFALEQDYKITYVTTGTDFADALTGAVLAAKNKLPLVLSSPKLPEFTSNYLLAAFKENTKIIGLGGEKAVPTSLLKEIAKLMVTGPAPKEMMEIAVYYLKEKNNDFILVREVHLVEKNAGVARAALNELIKGEPLTQGAYRVLPSDTEILDINIVNGLATVDFSKEVLKANVGISGEALGIASIVNTLTEFPTIKKVEFTVEGSTENAMDWWGHVGLYDQPFSRDLSAVYEPIIWVDSPVQNQIIQSPMVVKGNAMVFEATVSFRLKDSHGNILAQGFTTAEAGAPQRGNFEAILNFIPSEAGRGQLEVYEVSAKDGSDQNMIIIPVKW